jgi:hypothetical protein
MLLPLAALLAAAVAVTAGVATAGSPAATTYDATRDAIAPQVSTNWGGYTLLTPDAVTPLAFSDATATWVEPKATCTVGRADSAAFWVGLGGYSDTSPALEQLGTGTQCDGSSTKAIHGAWWEVIPAPAVSIPMKVAAGDKMNAALLVQGQTITFSLKNLTRHTRFSKVINARQPLDVTSAEWIAEAPSSCTSAGHCSVVPLTNFGTVTFQDVALIANDHPGTLVDPTWLPTPIELITESRSNGLFGTTDVLGPGIGAVPGDLSADGRSFSVSWQKGLAR